MPQEISQIFVSYSHDDKDWVDVLFKEPIRTTKNVSFAAIDFNSLVPGEEFDKKLKKEIKASTGFVFLVSNSFLTSKYVQEKEWKWIRKSNSAARICCIELGNAFGDIIDVSDNKFLSDLQRLHRDQDSQLPEAIPQTADELQACIAKVNKSIRRMLDPYGTAITDRLEARKLHSIELFTKTKFSTVYTAKTQTFDKKLAIKVQRKGMAKEFEEGMKSAHAMSTIPNFVHIYEIDKDNKPYYCITEFVDGTTLDELLKEKVRENRRIPLKDVQYILLKLSLALKSVHERGMSHLNIRPKNILIDANNEPYLLPSGRAREAFEKYNSQTLENKPTADSTAFALPEYLRGEDWENESADIYFLGLIAYWMIAGHPPLLFLNRDIVESDKSVTPIITSPPDLASIRPQCPVSFSHTVMRMLNPNPGDRFRKFDDVLAGIMQCPDSTLACVELSWRRCLDGEIDIFERFYDRFFSEAGPEAELQFDTESWPTARQKNLLRDAVISLFRYYELKRSYRVVPLALNPLEGLASQHARRKILPAHFRIFSDALIDTAVLVDEMGRGGGNDNEIKRNWEAVIGPGSKYLQKRVKELRSGKVEKVEKVKNVKKGDTKNLAT